MRLHAGGDRSATLQSGGGTKALVKESVYIHTFVRQNIRGQSLLSSLSVTIKNILIQDIKTAFTENSREIPGSGYSLKTITATENLSTPFESCKPDLSFGGGNFYVT